VQYILIDFVFFAPVMFFIVKSRAVRRLKGNPPASNVFGPTTLTSILGSISIVLTTWYLLFWGVEKQWWYKRHKGEGGATENPDPKNLETTALYLVGCFLYVAAGTAVGWGGKWRHFIWRNIGLSLIMAFLLIFNVVQLFLPPRMDSLDVISYWLEVVPTRFAWRLAMTVLGLLAASSMIFWELVVVSGPVATYIRRRTGTGRKQQLEDEERWLELEEEEEGMQMSKIDDLAKSDEVTLDV